MCVLDLRLGGVLETFSKPSFFLHARLRPLFKRANQSGLVDLAIGLHLQQGRTLLLQSKSLLTSSMPPNHPTSSRLATGNYQRLAATVRPVCWVEACTSAQSRTGSRLLHHAEPSEGAKEEGCSGRRCKAWLESRLPRYRLKAGTHGHVHVF